MSQFVAQLSRRAPALTGLSLMRSSRFATRSFGSTGEPDLRYRPPPIPKPDSPLSEDMDLMFFDACHPEPLLDMPDYISPHKALAQLLMALGGLYGVYNLSLFAA